MISPQRLPCALHWWLFMMTSNNVAVMVCRACGKTQPALEA